MILPYMIAACLIPTLVSSIHYKLSKDYSEINKYLVEHLPKSEDVKTNFELSNEWLRKRQNRICGLGNCIGSSLSQAIEKFIELYEVTGSREICTPSAIEILRKNKAAISIGETWHVPVETRVSRLIIALGQKMAEECQSSSEYIFSERIKHLDATKLSTLQQHLDLLIQPAILWVRDKPAGATEFSQLEYEYDHYMFWNPTSHEDLIYTSFLLAKNYKFASEVKTEEERLRRFVEEFYLEPCEYYTDMLHGPLDPMLEYSRIVKSSPTLLNKEFYIGIGRYKWCRDLLKGSDRLIRNLVSNGQELPVEYEYNPKFKSLPAPYRS